jgi:hypothetical protein
MAAQGAPHLLIFKLFIEQRFHGEITPAISPPASLKAQRPQRSWYFHLPLSRRQMKTAQPLRGGSFGFSPGDCFLKRRLSRRFKKNIPSAPLAALR